MWTATRKGYVEKGCKFLLQPFTAQREPYGNNISSLVCGVSKRYTDDPFPVSYNFIQTPSPSHTSAPVTTTQPYVTGTTYETSLTPMADMVLSKITQIGIGVGVSLGIVLVAVTVRSFILCKRRYCRKSIRKEPPSKDPSGNMLSNSRNDCPDQLHVSQRNSVNSRISNDTSTTQDRRLSELMSTERVELNAHTLD